MVAACFGSQLVATAIGAAGLSVSSDELGWLLVKCGQVGVVLFPFVLIVLWVAEADRRGDL